MSYTNTLLITILTLVTIAIIYLCIKYSFKPHPTINQKHSNICLEIIWTAIPIIILACICSPSFKLLKYQLTQKRNPFLTIKVTAHQWYWNYEYILSTGKINYNSHLLKTDHRQSLNKTNVKLYPRLLATDYELIVPTGKVIRLLVTSADVIHGFTIPSFGVKIDAVPGKINDTWIKVRNEGIYYGQCSEFCGKDHAFMPIAVRALTLNKFNKWLTLIKQNINIAFKLCELDNELTN